MIRLKITRSVHSVMTFPARSSLLSPVTEKFSSNGATWIKKQHDNMITWQHDKSEWRRWEWIAWRVKCRHIKLRNWSIMLSSHYWEATERNVDLSVCACVRALIHWAVRGLNCVSLGSMLLTVDQPKLIFNKPLQGKNGDGLLLQRKGLMCFTPRSTKWMTGLLICLHLN